MKTKKINELQQYIETADLALQQARDVVQQLAGDKLDKKIAQHQAQQVNYSSSNQIIEGVFSGQEMVGPDGKQYSVPANYASKSKLVEGDTLKLTIQDDGSFLYKQIKPTERKRLKAKLLIDEITGQYATLAEDGKKYNLLTASVTYFKGEPNDQLTILVPKNSSSRWAAIENIIKNENSSSENNNKTNNKNLQNEIEKQLKDLKPEKKEKEREKFIFKKPIENDSLEKNTTADLEDL